MSLLSFNMPLLSRKGGGTLEYDGDTKTDGGASLLENFASLEAPGVSKDDDNNMAYKMLKQLFAPFVLRRRKADALKQLPKKVCFVPSNVCGIVERRCFANTCSLFVSTDTNSRMCFPRWGFAINLRWHSCISR